MMNIHGTDTRNTISMQIKQNNFMGKATDSLEKGIQHQIGNVQKQLQELSSNKEMSIEEKMKKRQELQEQINDLNKQLRQHQIDQRREMQKTKSPSKEASNHKMESSKKAGFSQASMTAMISADSAINQAKNLEGIVTQMEGRKNTLATEIKLDAQRGRDVEAKQGELEDLENCIMKVEASQITTMNKANKDMSEAAKTDQKAEKTEEGKKEKIKKEDETENTKIGSFSEKEVTKDAEKETVLQTGAYYTRIDVLL